MKHSFFEQKKYTASDFFKTPPEMVINDFLVHVLGTKYVIVENYKCVQGFSGDCLVVKGKKQKLIIKGSDLMIRYFGDQEVEISGNINSIDFLEL